MLLVQSITFYFHYIIWGCMCSIGPFQFRWLKGYIYSSCCNHHQIGSNHLSHDFIFSVAVCLRCLLHHILSLMAYTFRENREFVQQVGYVLACRSYSFVCTFTVSLSSLCKIIWRPWTYQNVCQIYVVECVKWGIFSHLSIMQYVGLCVFSLTISPVMIEKVYILCLIIITKPKVWTTIHCLGLGYETIVCAVCLFIFL